MSAKITCVDSIPTGIDGYIGTITYGAADCSDSPTGASFIPNNECEGAFGISTQTSCSGNQVTVSLYSTGDCSGTPSSSSPVTAGTCTGGSKLVCNSGATVVASIFGVVAAVAVAIAVSAF